MGMNTARIKPHKIIALTETTRATHFRLRIGGPRVSLWRGFALLGWFAMLLLASGCASPRRVFVVGCADGVDTQLVEEAARMWEQAMPDVSIAVQAEPRGDVVIVWGDATK